MRIGGARPVARIGKRKSAKRSNRFSGLDVCLGALPMSGGPWPAFKKRGFIHVHDRSEKTQGRALLTDKLNPIPFRAICVS